MSEDKHTFVSEFKTEVVRLIECTCAWFSLDRNYSMKFQGLITQSEKLDERDTHKDHVETIPVGNFTKETDCSSL